MVDKKKVVVKAKSGIPEPVPQIACPHGNHYCLACEDCGRQDPRNMVVSETPLR